MTEQTENPRQGWTAIELAGYISSLVISTPIMGIRELSEYIHICMHMYVCVYVYAYEDGAEVWQNSRQLVLSKLLDSFST